MSKFIPLLLLAAVFGAPAAHAGKLVCWTDDKGRRACGDRVPPQYAKGEREILDAQGRVIEKKGREKTPEEIAAAEALRVAAAAEAERHEKQSKYDRYLLQTFTSAKELEAARDARLKAIEGQMLLNDKANADTEKNLKSLHARAAAKKAGKAADPKLLKQIKEFETALAEGRRARAQRSGDHAAVTAKFGADIERYDQLRSGQIEVGSAVTAKATSLSPAAN